MEEKKKLLLVAISVGVFLVISIGAGIFFASKSAAVPSGTAMASRPMPEPVSGSGVIVPPPSAPLPPVGQETPVPETSLPGASLPGTPENTTASLDPVDLVRNPGVVPGLTPAPEGSLTEGDFYVSGKNQETIISVPKPSTAAVPNAPPAGRAASAPRPAPAPVPIARPKPVAQPRPPVQTKIYDDFWVQTGAFSNIARAEGVKETLAAKGISSIIENREVDGKTLFRVRVGPYTSQNEADYWLSLIKSLGGFEDSQVRQTQSRR